MSTYSIKQLELVSGIKAHTIRMWEKRYGLFSPQRTNTNIRRYSESNVQLILNIALLTRNGYRISKVANKSSEEISELILKHSSQLTSNYKIDLEPIIQSILSFNQSGLKSYINRSIKELGLEKTFEYLFTPLLYRIGILWQTGMINSTHEHFVSNIIKQTIVINTETIKEPKIDAPLFLFFLPEGEFHEIGLMFFTYIGKKMGYRTLYLGQSTPVDDVVQTAKKLKPIVVFTSVTTIISKINLVDFLKKLQKDIPFTNLFITGYKANQDKNSIPKSINIISSLESFTDKLVSLRIK